MAEAVLGIFAAFAGMYGYFTVLYNYGFLPSHLIDEIDRSGVFNYVGEEASLRDAYYLWCSDPSITTRCYYYPNFYDGPAPNQYHNNTISYYDQYQWYQWQRNSAEYANAAKKYLIEITSRDGDIDDLNMDQLQGLDDSGNVCCNTQKKDLSTDTSCTPEQGCLSWNTFLNTYWSPTTPGSRGIFDVFQENVFKDSAGFKNRRCWDEDYFSEYMQPQRNQPPPYCDLRYTGKEYADKPRTKKDDSFSFFPIQTRSRTEALARAQSAYLVAIVIMQFTNLLTVRTRISSIFQQGMKNTFMNYAILCELCLMGFLIYIPWANIIVGSRPLKFIFWTPSLPYAICVLIYHELRKCFVRRDKNKNKNSFITRNTVW